MDVERIIEEAYEIWKRAWGFFAINGLLAYALFVVLLSLAFWITGVDPYNLSAATPLSLVVFAIVYALAVLLKHVYLIAVAYVGRKREYLMRKAIKVLRDRFIDVGISTLLVVLALLTGGLLAELLATIPASIFPGASYIGLLALLGFLYVALRFSLAPFYAIDMQWEDALRKSLEQTRKHLVSVLLIETFFSLMTFFIIAVHPVLYFFADALFLTHLVNLTLFGLVEARR